MTPCVVGIHGSAIAACSTHGHLMLCDALPTCRTGGMPVIDVRATLALLQRFDLRRTTLYMERPSPVTAGNDLARGVLFGSIIGAFVALGTGTQTMIPQRWRGLMRIQADDLLTAARTVFDRQFSTHDQASAALLARFGAQHLRSLSTPAATAAA